MGMKTIECDRAAALRVADVFVEAGLESALMIKVSKNPALVHVSVPARFEQLFVTALFDQMVLDGQKLNGAAPVGLDDLKLVDVE